MNTFPVEIEQFMDYLSIERGVSPHTLSNYRRDLLFCAETLSVKGRESFLTATYPELIHWMNELRKKKLSPKTISRRFYALRSFYKFLEGEGLLTENPTLKIEPMKTWANLPEVLTQTEIETLFASLTGETVFQLRMRAMFDVLYAAGLRVSELTHLRVQDIHAEVGYLECIGKGNKQRLVPLGQWAVESVRKWLEKGRPRLLKGAESEWLFVGQGGDMLTRQQVWSLVKQQVKAAGIARNVSPHTLRHSFATHLLERGMDLRSLQEMLGHASISTTQFYTKIEPEHLKQAHRKFHPRG